MHAAASTQGTFSRIVLSAPAEGVLMPLVFSLLMKERPLLDMLLSMKLEGQSEFLAVAIQFYCLL